MFERTAKETDASKRQDTKNREAEKTFASLRSSSKGGDAAVIGRSIQINGDLRGGEDLRIEGDVSGTVELREHSLTIGREGKVKADVYAKSIAVDGDVKGDLYANESVFLHVNARVQGNIFAPKIGIEEGAHFKGSIEMDPAAIEKVLGKPNTSTKSRAESPVADLNTKGRPAAQTKGSDNGVSASSANA